MLIQGLFYLFAAVLVLAALGVIVARNPVYAALGLLLSPEPDIEPPRRCPSPVDRPATLMRGCCYLREQR